MRELAIETTTHGRVLVRDAVAVPPSGTLVCFHGYGQSADDMLVELSRVSGAARWAVVCAQALSRFYTRNDERVVASWMTRQDRDLAIADNVSYIDRVVEAVGAAPPIVFLGFSQGAAMAYRAAVLGRHRARAVMTIGGDIPPELKSIAADRWPPAYLASGDRDHWFTPANMDADRAFLASHGVAAEYVGYAGGHEWTGALRDTIGNWLAALDASRA
jgi:predicted esterase